VFEKLLKVLLGIILIPLTLSTFYQFPFLFASLNSYFDSFILLFLGALLYLVFETLLHRPMRTYVFGHELTHALDSLAMGGRVHSFKVSHKGGSVSLSKSNMIIALAPYCIPIYTLCIMLIYFLIKLWLPHAIEHYKVPFFLMIGFSLAFHLSLTLYAIRQDQPDIKKTGSFFSLVFILLINGWILVFLSKILFWDLFSVKTFLFKTMKTQILMWKWIILKGTQCGVWSLNQCASSAQQNSWLFKLKSFLQHTSELTQ
jgi:hypothetical protein